MKQPNDVFNDFQAQDERIVQEFAGERFERNVKAMLSQGFSKLDLVTREEFDTQTQVLVRTRARLEELEQPRRRTRTEAAGRTQRRQD